MATTHQVILGAARALEVLKGLRPQDAIELDCLGQNRELTLREGINDSKLVFTGLLGDEVACVGGFRDNGFCQPTGLWLVTNRLVERAPLRFLREGLKIVNYGLHTFGPLGGFVLVSNDTSVKWLKWMKFNFEGPFDFDPIGPCYRFERVI